MTHIVVSPLSQLPLQVAHHHPSHIITLTSGDIPPLPGACKTERLCLSFHDIVEPRDGLVLADADQMRQLLDFVQGWNRQAPLLIHCYAGVSRSPAAAYIAALALDQQLDEKELAMKLRALSPSATPNIRLVTLADQLLERQGRMVQAIRSIGRGADAFEGEVFSLPVSPDLKSCSA